LNETEVASFIPSKNSSIEFFEVSQSFDNQRVEEESSDANQTISSFFLDFDASSWKKLSVHSVSWKTEGTWSCEVFADVTFQRDRAEKMVSIIGEFH
jgi:hypothetical protein